MMKVIGIDLSGPSNMADTCMVIFDEHAKELHFLEAHEGASDRQILEILSKSEINARIIVGLDAPLSYNPGGGDRESDKELRKLVKMRGGGVGVMTPTMTRMVYLTLRGVVLARMLETLESKVEIVEVHPGACLLLRDAPAEDVKQFKRDPSARAQLCEWLETQGLKRLPAGDSFSDHFVAACAAALGAWKWALGKSVWRFAAHPPEHPYEFAC